MDILKLMKGIFSLDALIYLAIVLVFLFALMRCLLPLMAVSGKLRRAARVMASSRLSAIITPLPRARPSALMTVGMERYPFSGRQA